jgi:hypothetical protein
MRRWSEIGGQICSSESKSCSTGVARRSCDGRDADRKMQERALATKRRQGVDHGQENVLHQVLDVGLTRPHEGSDRLEERGVDL